MLRNYSLQPGSLLLVAALLITCNCQASEGSRTAPSTVFTNVTVIDVERGIGLPAQTVIVAGDQISQVAPTQSIASPSGALIVDASGKYLIPGLWDSHAHLAYAGPCALPVLVAYGITGVRDLGGDLKELLEWRTAIQQDRIIGPTIIKVAGPNIESARWLDAASQILDKQFPQYRNYFETSPRLRVGSPADARAAVAILQEMGVDLVKFRNLGGEEFRALAAEVHIQGMRLAGHAAAGLTLAEAAEAGQDSIEHGESISSRLVQTSRAERLAQFKRVAASGTMITPTLVLDRARSKSAEEMLEVIENHSKYPYVSPRLREMWRFSYDTRGIDDIDWPAVLTRSTEDLKVAKEAGVQFLVGTDLGFLLIAPGSSVHEEMAMMVRLLDLTPAEALRAATLNPAKWLELQELAGSITPGRIANMVLLDADPLEDISNTRKIYGVMVGGRWLDKDALSRLLENTRRSIAEKGLCMASDQKLHRS